jgi:chromosome transmission fidelity protein 1
LPVCEGKQYNSQGEIFLAPHVHSTMQCLDQLTVDLQVSGYANKLNINQDGVNHLSHQQQYDEGSSIASFQTLADFLRSLLNCNDNGRIIVARKKFSGQPEDAYLKFVMLCAEKIFLEVL